MILETLKKTGIPTRYSHFKNEQKPPYITYIGDGQDQIYADDKGYYSKNKYQVEFYFKNKNEELESVIEKILIDDGYTYEKSEDVFIESEGLFVIYYKVI